MASVVGKMTERGGRPVRRLSKDYERLCTTSEAWISVALIRLMAKRLARS